MVIIAQIPHLHSQCRGAVVILQLAAGLHHASQPANQPCFHVLCAWAGPEPDPDSAAAFLASLQEAE